MIPVSYNIRSLVVRRTTTGATIFGIALVVWVLASTIMLNQGVTAMLARNGGRDAAIVMRKGSDNELSSIIDQNKIGLILSAPGVKKTNGLPLGTGEVVMMLLMEPTRAPGGYSNVQFRGVEPDVKRFRPDLKIVEGQEFKAGSDEVIVGRAIAGNFTGLTIGGTIEPKKNRTLKVVGVFEAGGSAMESEVWGDVDTVKSLFGREGMVSSVRVKLDSAAAFDAFKASVEGDKQLGLQALTEEEWGAKQSLFLAIFVTALGVTISFFLSIGAMIGAMITMYASIANRQREIGTLRAIGFPRWQILFSFLLESVTVAFVGGLIGSLAALCMGFVRVPMLNFATFSEMVFTFEPTPVVFVVALGFSLGMGLFGGLLPAVRAARMSPVQAMRG